MGDGRPSAASSVARNLLRYWNEGLLRDEDRIVVEEPLQVRTDGDDYAVLMRTPGHDVELAVGFLHSERVVRSSADVLAIEVHPSDAEPELRNVVDVKLLPEARARRPPPREARATSACGVCGRRSIEEVRREAPAVTSHLVVAPSLLQTLPAQMGRAQETFHATGGLHAAALFDGHGRISLLFEDVGRHNAVDKVVGHALLHERLPLDGSILLVSGRCGFEIAEKAVLAGIPIVCSVSAPSSLAVDLAAAADVTIVGFLRDGAFNVYSASHRIGS